MNRMSKLRDCLRIGLVVLLLAQMSASYFAVPMMASAAPIIPDAITTTTPSTVPVYQGVDKSIEAYLCTPTDANVGTALFDCISKVYRFGIAFGAIALVFFIVFAGYMYMVGGESGKSKGKSMFISSLTGMAIILSSYVLLSFINPDLVKIKVIQPPIFSANDVPKCADVGLGENCVLPDGQINVGGSGNAGSASEAKYSAMIAKYAPRLANSSGVNSYCALSALLSKESSYRYNVASNGDAAGNSINIDVNSSNKKFYNLSFLYHGAKGNDVGHGIGLGQIFIYGPPAQWKAKGWPDSATPARNDKANFGYANLTVTDLIDPDKNLDASSFYFAKLMKDHGNDIAAAYHSYSGGEAPFQTGTNSTYNQCVLRQGK
jgi:hypothetical protein